MDSIRQKLSSASKRLPKFCRWVFILLLAAVLALSVYLIAAKLLEGYSEKQAQGPGGKPSQAQTISQSFFKLASMRKLNHLENSQRLKENPSALRLYNQAVALGYSQPRETVQFTNQRGAQTTVTTLANDSGKVIFLTEISGIGKGREYLTQIDQPNNTLTTFNDSQSGIKTNLTSGEIIESWGPLTSHSQAYDYNLDECVGNFMVWHLGLASSVAYQLFEAACGDLFPPEDLVSAIPDFLEILTDPDPAGLVEDNMTCAAYIGTVYNSADSLIESGAISSYLPDLTLGRGIGEDPKFFISYVPGRLSVKIQNRGLAYSGPFELAFYSKINEQEWTYIKSLNFENMRPQFSNNSFPYPDEYEAVIDYTAQEGEVISVKIDPQDLIEEKEETNNTALIGREILNQAPVISKIMVSSDYIEAGKYLVLRADGLDPDGHLALRGFEWDFGDGAIWRAEDTILYAFGKAGERTVKVRVKDAENLWSDWSSRNIIVTEPLLRTETQKSQINIVSAFDAPYDDASGLAWDGSSLWVAGDKLYQLNPANGAVIKSLALPDNIKVEPGERIALAWAKNSLWLLSAKLKTVYQLTKEGQVLNRFPSPNEKPTGIFAIGNAIYVINDNKTFCLLKQDGFCSQIREFPINYYSMSCDGFNFWAIGYDPSSQGSIHRLNQEYQPEKSFKAAFNSKDISRYGGTLVYQPQAAAWDGRYLWILGNKAASWGALLYKCETFGLSVPYFEIPQGFIAPLQGIPWDANGFLTISPFWKVANWQNRLSKISPSGELLSKMEGAVTGGDDIAIAGNDIWIGGGGIMNKISSAGEVLESWNLGNEEIHTLTWDGTNWWVADWNTIYRVDKQGKIEKTFTAPPPLSEIADIIWLGNNLWVADTSQRIFKLDVGADKLETAEIHSFALDTDSPSLFGGAMAWDGSHLWLTDVRKVYQLDYIAVNGPAVNSEPVFSGAQQEVVDIATPEARPGAKPIGPKTKGPHCAALNITPKDSDWKEQTIYDAYVVSENEIYFADSGALRKYTGSQVIDIIDMPGKQSWLAGFNPNHIIISAWNGLYEYRNKPDLIEITGKEIDYKFNPDRIYTLNDGTAYAAGSVSHCPSDYSLCAAVAKYDGAKWTIPYSYPDKNFGFGAIYMFSHNLGYTVGNGDLFKFNGTDWKKVESCATNKDVYDIDFLSPNEGYITYWGGKVQKYDGSKCADIPGLPDKPITNVYAKSSSEIYVVGWGSDTFYKYNGSQWLQIKLSQITAGKDGRTFNMLTNIKPISDNKILLLGAEGSFVICENL